MTQKEGSYKNQKKPKVSEEIIIKKNKIDKKENDPTNSLSLIEDCEQIRTYLSEKTLETVRGMSNRLSVNDNKLTDMESAITCQKKLVKSVEENDKLENQNINNMHEMLRQNNNSKSKCMGAGGVIGSTGGTVVIIAGASAGNPIIAGAVIFIGGIMAFYCACIAVNGFYNLYKKPNSAIESIDIEQSMHKNCRGLLSSIT
ncbi:hypothetical protein [Candidatus Mesenet endosymbiont of Agriotes lineatus]|uniref:hypothetical protein n=1 Tax=Candidatus Mesenet endosymbiont of Agriotes lineatus TaxID=3077948 RepID=UPI0030CF9BE3